MGGSDQVEVITAVCKRDPILAELGLDIVSDTGAIAKQTRKGPRTDPCLTLRCGGKRFVEGAHAVKEPELPIPVIAEHVEQRDEDVQLLVDKEGGADREQVGGVESVCSVQGGEGGIVTQLHSTQLHSNLHCPYRDRNHPVSNNRGIRNNLVITHGLARCP